MDFRAVGKRMIKRLLALGMIFVLGVACETPNGTLTLNPTNPLASDSDIDRLTKGGTTLPSSGDISKTIDRYVTAPAGGCEEVGEKAPPKEEPSGRLPASGKGVCKHYKNFTNQGVPEKALKQALLFYKSNPGKFKNKRFISIADYSKRSTEKRFFKLDMETGRVKKYKVSHGSGSQKGGKHGDPNHDGHIDKCKVGNNRTNMTRPGFFSTGERYMSAGKGNNHVEKRNSRGHVHKGWPYISKSPKLNAMRLDGLTPSINGHARNKGVVMHGAWYNESKVTGSEVMGRSYGCPAFAPDDTAEILNSINGGSLYYSYVPKCADDMQKAEAQVPGWKTMCN